MTSRRFLALALIALAASAPAAPGAQTAAAAPIALHPENPHYFLWRGRPTILITSAEHYGAVINLDFDYRKYLDTLAADGMNYTRVFSGAYVEPQGAFKIARNTLAPRTGTVPRALGAREPARVSQRRQQVRPLALGRRLLRQAEGLRLARRGAKHRRRAHALLPDVRGSAVEPQPDERGQQRQRRGRRRAQRGLHARQGARPAGGAGGADPQARHRAERLRQSLLRDRQRAVFRRRDDGLAAPHRGRHRGDRARAAGEAPDRAEHRQQVGEDRRPAPGGVDLQLPLREPARDGRDELRARTRRSATTRPASAASATTSTGWRAGTSSSPAAGCTTISITRSPPATRTGRSSTRRHSPAAAAGRCAAS